MKKNLVLKRVPPGDNWRAYLDADTVQPFTNLTAALAYISKKYKVKEFYINAKDGEVWTVSDTYNNMQNEIDDFYGDKS